MSVRRCPKCGEAALYVQYSDHKKDGLQHLGINHRVIRRRLGCEECGHMVTTYEIEAEDLRGIRDTLYDIRRKARLSKTIMGKLKTAIQNCQKGLEEINGETWK